MNIRVNKKRLIESFEDSVFETVSDDLAEGKSAGEVDDINWELSIQGFKRDDFNCPAFYDYLLKEISFKVAEGKFDDVGLYEYIDKDIINIYEMDKDKVVDDLKMLGVNPDELRAFTDNDDYSLEYFIDYSIDFDGELPEDDILYDSDWDVDLEIRDSDTDEVLETFLEDDLGKALKTAADIENSKIVRVAYNRVEEIREEDVIWNSHKGFEESLEKEEKKKNMGKQRKVMIPSVPNRLVVERANRAKALSKPLRERYTIKAYMVVDNNGEELATFDQFYDAHQFSKGLKQDFKINEVMFNDWGDFEVVKTLADSSRRKKPVDESVKKPFTIWHTEFEVVDKNGKTVATFDEVEDALQHALKNKLLDATVKEVLYGRRGREKEETIMSVSQDMLDNSGVLGEDFRYDRDSLFNYNDINKMVYDALKYYVDNHIDKSSETEPLKVIFSKADAYHALLQEFRDNNIKVVWSTPDTIKEDFEYTDTDSTPAPGPDMGVSNMLITLINGEWNTIKDYNDFVATITSEGGYDDLLAVIQDIAKEENVHVGQLQKALETLSPNVTEISKGEEEAEGQLDETDAIAKIEEPVKDEEI